MTRALISLTAAGASALVLAACGGDGAAGRDDASSPSDRAHQGALNFARCMRENGVDMPDPEVGQNGLVKVAPGAGQGPDPESPKTRRALERCEEHLQQEGGGAPPDAMSAEHRDAFVAYARCMRDEGIDMPDPSADGGMVFKVGDPDAPNPESPAFKAADKVCHKHLAAVDAEVKKEGAE